MAKLTVLVATVSFAAMAMSAGFTGIAFAQTEVPDMNRAQPTADQAGQKMSDREMMQKIRQMVVDDDALSTTAKNVKIISKDGRVTLKGPVRSEEEKQNIHAKAASVAGETNVVNEISVNK